MAAWFAVAIAVLPVTVVPAAFRAHVILAAMFGKVIFSGCYNPKMLDIAAGSIAASVIDLQSFRHWAISLLPDQAMDKAAISLKAYLSIAIFLRFTAQPDMASSRSLHHDPVANYELATTAGDAKAVPRAILAFQKLLQVPCARSIKLSACSTWLLKMQMIALVPHAVQYIRWIHCTTKYQLCILQASSG